MIQYRKDIDGLRTLAVLPVLLFHAGIPGFGGGYVGVDIFFVISGFLITSILLKDLADDKFSLAVFYERRARRILPALTVVIIFSIAVSYWFSIPRILNGVTRSTAWLTIFSSNIYFKKEFGYFDAEATTKPLLHTWSLSVEEQFYILFPVLLYFGWKYARRYLALLIVVLMSLSVAASLVAVRKDPSAAFYYLQFRAWEMGLGSLLAFAAQPEINFRLPRLSRLVSELGSLLGLAGIVIPIVLYNHHTRFPGMAAFPPCIGTFLLLWTNTNGHTFVGRVLATRLAVGIGLLSYSLYLWHWPLLVFGTLYKGEALTPTEGLAILGVTFAAAWLSVRFVEKPFREKRLLGNRKRILVTSTIVLLVLGSASLTISKINLLSVQSHPTLFDDPRLITQNFPNLETWEVNPGVKVLSIGDRAKPGILLIGDSFANHWVAGLATWGSQHDLPVHIQAMSSNLPLLDSYVPELEIRYQFFYNRLRNQSFGLMLDRLNVKHVILAAYWKPFIDPEQNLVPFRTMCLGDKTPSTMVEQRALIAQQLEKTIQFFNARGCKVWLMQPPPDYSYNVSLKLAALVRRQLPIKESYMPLEVAQQRRQLTTDLLHNAVAQHSSSQAEILDPLQLFCQDGYCITAKDERSLYQDDVHLSYDGSMFGQQVFQPIAIAEGIDAPVNQELASGKNSTTKQ